METNTQFDLNQAVQRWREDLGQSPIFRTENLYELETHLRDSIATLKQVGLSDTESFFVAKLRVGTNGSLENEFAKENANFVWLDRALWILLGAQLWGLASVLSFSFQTFLQAAIPIANEWLSTYGFGKISGEIPGQFFYVVVLPLLVLGGAKSFSLINRVAEQRGWFSINSILSKPRWLAVIYGLLCFLPGVIQYGVGVLIKSFGLERYSGMSLASGYGLYVLLILQAAIFTVVVTVISRRRFRLSRN